MPSGCIIETGSDDEHAASPSDSDGKRFKKQRVALSSQFEELNSTLRIIATGLVDMCNTLGHPEKTTRQKIEHMDLHDALFKAIRLKKESKGVSEEVSALAQA